MMQTAREVGKYVTDGKKIYPYNSFLDDMVSAGKLTFCERPTSVATSPKPTFRSPVNFTADERLEIAQKIGATLGEVTNMSPQEFEAELVKIEAGAYDKPAPTTDGFPS